MKSLYSVAAIFIYGLFLFPSGSGLIFGEDNSSEIISGSKTESNDNGAEKRNYYFPNTDIRSAFKAVAVVGKTDIVLSPNVTGKVMLSLTSKTWKQAMTVLCQMLNLHYIIQEQYIYIQTLAEYNTMSKEGQLAKEIIHLKHTKVSDLLTAVSGMITERGKVTAVEKSNAFIITDLKDKMAEIKKSINILDVETYQVHIQAQIIEVNSNAIQNLGINWGFGSGTPSPDLADIPSASQSMAVLGQSSPGRIAEPSLSLGLRLLDGKLGIAIENLISEGMAEVVAKPQITTMDNTTASIFIGEKRPYLKLDKDLNSVTEFIDAGVGLEVTPHVTNDGRVIMDITPERSESRTDPVTRGPIVTTTEAKTTVVVNDGETVVIGGLTSKSESKIETGIPFLKDIPLLGVLFRSTSKKVDKKDLIIFITPYVVKSDGTNADLIKPAGQKMSRTPPARNQSDIKPEEDMPEKNVDILLREMGSD